MADNILKIRYNKSENRIYLINNEVEIKKLKVDEILTLLRILLDPDTHGSIIISSLYKENDLSKNNMFLCIDIEKSDHELISVEGIYNTFDKIPLTTISGNNNVTLEIPNFTKLVELVVEIKIISGEVGSLKVFADCSKLHDDDICMYPVADFTVLPEYGLNPLEVTLTDKSFGDPPVTSWIWEVRQSIKLTYTQISLSTIPPLLSPPLPFKYVFMNIGIYEIRLTAGNECASNKKSDYILVCPDELRCDDEVKFSVYPTSGCGPLTVSFTNKSGYGFTEFLWDFGDGTKFTGKTPLPYTYSKPGEYYVTLRAVGPECCGISPPNKTKITVEKCECDFDVDFDANPSIGCENDDELTVHFTSHVTTDNEIQSYLWTFGDGKTDDVANPVHTYVGEGKYTVTLTVYVKGCDYPGHQFKENYVMVCPPPCYVEVDFNAYPRIGCDGDGTLTVDFWSDVRTLGEIEKYVWNFGDGTGNFEGEYLEDIEHTYVKEGYYTVELIVYVEGCDDQPPGREIKTDYIHVICGKCCAYQVDFEGYPRRGNDGDDTLEVYFWSDVTFPFDCDIDIERYEWEFGDGGKSYLEDPEHTYQGCREYTVKLTVYAKVNGEDCDPVSIVKKDYIEVTCGGCCDYSVDFEGFPTIGNDGDDTLEVYFWSNVTFSSECYDYEIMGYEWEFGDGTIVKGPEWEYEDVTHTYTGCREYTVKLTVYAKVNGNDCVPVSSVVKKDYIEVTCGGCCEYKVDFDLWPSYGCDDGGNNLTVDFWSFVDYPYDPRCYDFDFEVEWYEWAFGDGVVVKGSEWEYESVTHTYKPNNGCGTYTVKLTVKVKDCDPVSIVKKDCVEVICCKPPCCEYKVDFDGWPESGNDGDNTLTVEFVSFVDFPYGYDCDWEIEKYVWNVGDGTGNFEGKYLEDIKHKFVGCGEYDVTLSVYVKDCENPVVVEKKKYIEVTCYDCCKYEVDFEQSGDIFCSIDESGKCEVEVSFWETATILDECEIEKYVWTFGSGSNAVILEGADLDGVTHKFTKSGKYDVKLEIYVKDCAPRFKYKPDCITIDCTECDCCKYEVDFEASQESGCDDDGNGLTVDFWIKDESIVSECEIEKYVWNFGDKTGNFEGKYLDQITHTYTENGDYTVTLSVYVVGCEHPVNVVKEEYIHVRCCDPGPCDCCEYWVDFEGLPDSGCENDNELTVSFKSDVEILPDCNNVIEKYEWDFGDGSEPSYKNNANPIHTYVGEGKYTVTLTVYVEGCDEPVFETKEDYIFVCTDPCDADVDFDAVPTEGCEKGKKLSVIFKSEVKTTGEIENYVWNFGDGSDPLEGNTLAHKNPLHTYVGEGYYTVTLTVFIKGCYPIEVSIDDFIFVDPDLCCKEPPIAMFNMNGKSDDKITGSAPFNVSFEDLSTNSPANGKMKYLWYFDDDTYISDGRDKISDPIYQFKEPGNYMVSLTVEDDCDISEPKTKEVEVTDSLCEPPIADFYADPTEGCDTLVVQFTNQSSGTTPMEFLWEFGDGSTSTDEHPRYEYNNDGEGKSYDVILTVSNDCGTNFKTKQDYINLPLCNPCDDTQRDMLICIDIKKTENKINDISLIIDPDLCKKMDG